MAPYRASLSRTCLSVTATSALAGGLWSTAHASMLDLVGYGARGMALTGAVAADARGHESVYYNPAGLAWSDRRAFTVGYQHLSLDLSLNGDALSLDSAPATVLGFEVPLPFRGALANRLALGAGFVIPVGSVLLADVPVPGEASYLLLEDRAQTVSLQLALGVRLSETLAVGAGFIALAQLGGAIVVAPNETGRIGSTVNDELLADYAPTLGVRWTPAPGTSLGATFRGESMATFSLPLDADLGEGFPIPVPRLDISGVAQYDPRQVVFEVAGHPFEPLPLRLGGGVTWKQWSRYPGAIAFTAVPDGYPAQPKPEFRDTAVWRIGAELVPGEVIPRVGFAYEPTPVPAQRGLHNALDNDRMIFGLGLGWRPESLPLRVDAGVQMHELLERSYSKRADRLAPFGPPEENPGWPRVTHDGRLFAFGLELGIVL
jgi:long-chain fatty acid transport protein